MHTMTFAFVHVDCLRRRGPFKRLLPAFRPLRIKARRACKLNMHVHRLKQNSRSTCFAVLHTHALQTASSQLHRIQPLGICRVQCVCIGLWLWHLRPGRLMLFALERQFSQKIQKMWKKLVWVGDWFVLYAERCVHITLAALPFSCVYCAVLVLIVYG